MKQLLVISRDPALRDTRKWLLQRLDHEVESVLDSEDLTDILKQRGCLVAVVGYSVPTDSKKRIAAQIRTLRPKCRIVELFIVSPEIRDADAHVAIEAGPEALLTVVSEQIAAVR